MHYYAEGRRQALSVYGVKTATALIYHLGIPTTAALVSAGLAPDGREGDYAAMAAAGGLGLGAIGRVAGGALGKSLSLPYTGSQRYAGGSMVGHLLGQLGGAMIAPHLLKEKPDATV